jgi:glycosyltransferase involved in cell wall biosynthesis
MTRRLFLVDHMCVLPYGHNLNALALFKKAFDPAFSEIISLVPRILPRYIKGTEHLHRVLNFPYTGYLPRPSKKAASPGLTESPPSIFRRRVLDYSALAYMIGVRRLSDVIGVDILRSATRKNWQRIFRQFQIGSDDVILFPSSDFYGVVSLLDFLATRDPLSSPHVHIRLIGVAENGNFSSGSVRPIFLDGLRKALQAGLRISVSAETPKYAHYLERLISAPVTYFPYPPAGEDHPLRWGDVKAICSPGQGRADKGFFRIFPIVSDLFLIGGKKFEIIIQNMRKTDPYYRKRYESILKNLPGVKLLNAQLRQEEIDKSYIDADIIILPYDRDSYALRGSAVYQEVLAFGRPVVCSKGTALADQVVMYGNGYLADSDSEFADQILKLSTKPLSEIKTMVEEARTHYFADFNKALQRITETLTQ